MVEYIVIVANVTLIIICIIVMTTLVKVLDYAAIKMLLIDTK